MKRRSRFVAVIGFLSVVGWSATEAYADWPNFRGVAHDGISSETGLKKKWDGAIPVVWEKPIGPAYSSFACVGDRVFTCGDENGKQVLYCFDAGSGKVVWQNGFEKEYKDSQGDGTRATPTWHDGRVYILGSHGRLFCADADSGREIWSRQFDGAPQWGFSGSVLIEGDLAVVSAGGEHGSLAAFDRITGKPVWSSGTDAAGYATPYPFTLDGRRYIVGFTAKAATIVDAGTGREVWRTDWKTDYDVNASSPIFHENHLFLSSGYRTGCAVFQLRTKGEELASNQIWKSKVLLNKFQSCILHDGHLYASDQKAFKCVDFLTGQERWSTKRVKHGTVVMADGHLFLLQEDGKLRIGPVSPDRFDVLSLTEALDGRCWTVPVIHNGRLYARNLERVVCFDLRP